MRALLVDTFNHVNIDGLAQRRRAEQRELNSSVFISYRHPKTTITLEASNPSVLNAVKMGRNIS